MSGTEARLPTTDPDVPERWRMLALLAVGELLGMSLWFAPNAARDQIGALLSLDPAQVGSLTAAVQLGFVAGTACAALLNLADVWPARFYFAGAALLASLANFALLGVSSYPAALLTRALTGFFLAGVYPPGMKMTATWFRSQRGLAIGIVVGALGLGKATPYLVHAVGMPSLGFVVGSTSLAAALAAVLVAVAYRDGPFPFERRPFDWKLVAAVVRHRETRLATAGYLGHMWELYAMWTWVPVFLAASLAAGASDSHRRLADVAAFGTLASGALGCVWGGWAARTLGYARVVTIAMAVSGACCLVIGLVFGAPPALLLPAVWLWGFFVVADSAQFSAMVTEFAPRHAVGTALTLQTSIGFLLTIVTMQMVPLIENAIGWRWAFMVLALGPLLGIAAIARLSARHPLGPRSPESDGPTAAAP